MKPNAKNVVSAKAASVWAGVREGKGPQCWTQESPRCLCALCTIREVAKGGSQMLLGLVVAWWYVVRWPRGLLGMTKGLQCWLLKAQELETF